MMNRCKTFGKMIATGTWITFSVVMLGEVPEPAGADQQIGD